MPTVLIVDDSLVDQRLVGGILRKETEWGIEYADNGADALAKIDEGGIDVVVTDMQMPEMDGLELVRSVKRSYSQVPVILMTGQGSEAIAAEALKVGAVSYLPKSKIGQILPEALEQISGMIGADRSYALLLDCMEHNEFSFRLPNDPELIVPVVDLTQQMVEGMKLCQAMERVRVGVALEHALLNAMFRGNLELSPADMEDAREKMLLGAPDPIAARRAEEPYSGRQTYVKVSINRCEAIITVKDEGPGFDINAVPQPGDPLALAHEGGRGLVLMNSFMDEVRFNETGNEVTLIKRHQAEETEPHPSESV